MLIPAGFRHMMSLHRDWVILGCLMLGVILITAAGAIVLHVRENHEIFADARIGTYSEPATGYPEIVPPDQAYPPPAKEQRTYYATYTEGDIQYSVTWMHKNVSRNPMMGNNIFTIELYNSRNASITTDSIPAAATIGCIAADNPYRTLQVQPKVLSFAPYETKKIELSLDVSCRYIGTADGKYFWRTY